MNVISNSEGCSLHALSNLNGVTLMVSPSWLSFADEIMNSEKNSIASTIDDLPAPLGPNKQTERRRCGANEFPEANEISFFLLAPTPALIEIVCEFANERYFWTLNEINMELSQQS